MRYLFMSLLVLVPILSQAHKFTEAIFANDLYRVSKLISEGWGVNEYDYECENSPLVDAIASGNIQIILLLLNAGADPNEYMIYREGTILEHPLLYATTVSQIVLLLAYGANPNNDYSREYNQAIADRRFLHLLVYYLWDFESKASKPEAVEQLNKIIFGMPVLRILALTTLLTSRYEIDNLCTRDKGILKQAFIYP